VLALSACCMSAFAWSALLREDRKFSMEDIQNATLAGGVAVGSSADLVIQPYGALIIGLLACFLSVFGYVYIGPFLKKTIGLDDTCGVHNLHGMPGLMGAIGGSISSAVAGNEKGELYGKSVGIVFPRRCGKFSYLDLKENHPEIYQEHAVLLDWLNMGGTYESDTKGINETALNPIRDGFKAQCGHLGPKQKCNYMVEEMQALVQNVTGCSAPGDGRTASEQAGIQVAAVAITLAIAIIGGVVTGILMKLPRKMCGQVDYEHWYEDKVYWEVEDGEESDDEEHPVTGTPVASRGGAVVTASEMVSLTVSGEDNMSGVKGR